MIEMSLTEVQQILFNAGECQPVVFKGISTDTRTLIAGNLFVAIEGDTFDGHDFIAETHQKGAVGLLVSHKVNSPLPQIIVNDTVQALGALSAAWRDRFSIPLIGITGSNGKTTLKNMVASILRAACHHDTTQVLATDGNLNNAIGLPLTLARLNEKHRYAVIEMGMNHFGEIAYLTQLAKPTVAVITNAAESHLEGLQTIEGVARAKGEIFQGLNKNGIAILNRDDTYFNYWRELIADQLYFTFGLENPADVTATFSEKQTIILHTPRGDIDVTLPLLGRHNIMNALAATAATLAVEIDLVSIKTGLEKVQPALHRMQSYFLENGARIIDDTYNANPFSLDAAVKTLATFSGTKIVVLGDMKELGNDAKKMHANAGEKIRTAGIDYLFTFGELSLETTKQFGGNATHFTDREKLIAALQSHIKNNTTVLVKGSRSMRMEQIVYELTPHIQHANAH